MKNTILSFQVAAAVISLSLMGAPSFADDGKAASQSSTIQKNGSQSGDAQAQKAPEGRDAPIWDKNQEIGALKFPVIHKIKDGILAVDNILVNKEAGAVTIKGEVNMWEGLVEYLACGKQGKLHESVLMLDVEPYYLQIALLLLNLEPGKKAISHQGADEVPDGDPVELWVSWKGADGKMVKYHAEELIFDKTKQTPMPSPNWVFTGSQVLQGRFMAQVEKSIVATYHDPFALIDHQLSTGRDDTIYTANSKILPPVGTSVSFTIQALKKPSSNNLPASGEPGRNQ
jgi:hypothetical protein